MLLEPQDDGAGIGCLCASGRNHESTDRKMDQRQHEEMEAHLARFVDVPPDVGSDASLEKP